MFMRILVLGGKDHRTGKVFDCNQIQLVNISRIAHIRPSSLDFPVEQAAPFVSYSAIILTDYGMELLVGSSFETITKCLALLNEDIMTVPNEGPTREQAYGQYPYWNPNRS